MKLNVLKQASLPDALTAELARRYHLVELTALTDADFRALAGTFTMLITNGEATVTRADRQPACAGADRRLWRRL